MPKIWLYYIAVVLPALLRLGIQDPCLEWMWYHNHQQAYMIFSAMSVQPQFLTLACGWAMPVFVVTVLSYWVIDDNSEGIPEQFLLLPIAYLPFTIIGDILVTRDFEPSILYTHPVLILPFGYAYVFIWAVFIRVMDKLRLVL